MVEILPDGVLDSDKDRVLTVQRKLVTMPDYVAFGEYLQSIGPRIWEPWERDAICQAGNEELQYMEWWRCRDSLPHLCANWLWIIDLDQHESLFRWNALQWLLHLNWKSHNLILKSRRVGITLYCQARYTQHCVFFPNTKVALVAHVAPSTEEIFERAKFMVERMPEWMRPYRPFKSWTQTGMAFSGSPFVPSLNSSYRIGTAQFERLGHGTDVDRLHLSEFGLYPNAEALMEGIAQAVRANPEISIESTGSTGDPGSVELQRQVNLARAGKTRYRLHFMPWYLKPENTMNPELGKHLVKDEEILLLQKSLNLTDAQVTWWQFQRNELGAKVYRQFPTTISDAFSTAEDPWFNAAKMRNIVAETTNIKPLAPEAGDPYWMGIRLSSEGEEYGGVFCYERPKVGWKYRAGVDCAGGESMKADESALVILDAFSLKQVLVAHGRWTIDAFADLLWCIVRDYCQGDPWGCPVAIELQQHGFGVIELLRRKIREQMRWTDKMEDVFLASVVPPNHVGKAKAGCEMTAKMRHFLFDAGKTWIEEGQVIITNQFCAEQFRSIIFDARTQRPDHPPSAHDDTVMATLIAAALALQPQYHWVPPQKLVDRNETPLQRILREDDDLATDGRPPKEELKSSGSDLADLYAGVMLDEQSKRGGR